MCVYTHTHTHTHIYDFVYASTDEHLGCFHILTIAHNAAMSLHVQVFLETYVFTSLGHLCRIGMAGSYGNSLFNILRHC